MRLTLGHKLCNRQSLNLLLLFGTIISTVKADLPATKENIQKNFQCVDILSKEQKKEIIQETFCENPWSQTMQTIFRLKTREQYLNNGNKSLWKSKTWEFTGRVKGCLSSIHPYRGTNTHPRNKILWKPVGAALMEPWLSWDWIFALCFYFHPTISHDTVTSFIHE